jgi:hypothetical protein
MLVLVLLSMLAAAGGTALASRFFTESRAERALAGIVLTLFVIHGSIHVLGWTSTLTPVSLGVLVTVVSALFVAAGVVRDRGGPRRALDAFLDLFRLPIEAITLTFHERSPALLGALAVPLLCAWSFYLAYLAPSSSWDGTWYHEPMVGWALQNHGFALVEVPDAHEWVNGYPRFAENLMLWMVAFWDRRLVDGVPSVMGMVVMLGTYVLARRFTASRSVALAAGAVIVTIPGALLQMRSTYIDLIVLAVFLPALHFATRPGFRKRDAWLAGISIALFASTKANAPLFAGFLMLAALVSTIAACRRERSMRTFVHALGGLALLLALVAPTVVRNVQEHDNPVWPLRLHSATLGFDFAGPTDIGNMQISLDQNLSEMYGYPAVTQQDYHDTRHHAWGWGLTFLGIPLLVVALGLATGALFGVDRARRDGAKQALAILFLSIPLQLASPAHHWARYSLGFGAASLVVIVWAFGRSRSIRFADGALGAMLVLNLVAFAWADPGWDVSRAQLTELREASPRERAAVDIGFSIYDSEYIRLREREFRPGDLLVFGDELTFLSNLWTERMDNRVVYVPYRSRTAFLERIGELAPRWVMVRPGTSADGAMRSAGSGYHPVMLAHEPEAFLFERGAPPEAPTP